MGRKLRVDRTPEEEVADCAARDEERKRLGDLPGTRDRSEALLPLERRSGTRGESSGWREKRCGRGNLEGSSDPATGTKPRTQITGN
jgi:hypothetical protein